MGHRARDDVQPLGTHETARARAACRSQRSGIILSPLGRPFPLPSRPQVVWGRRASQCDSSGSRTRAAAIFAEAMVNRVDLVVYPTAAARAAAESAGVRSPGKIVRPPRSASASASHETDFANRAKSVVVLLLTGAEPRPFVSDLASLLEVEGVVHRFHLGERSPCEKILTLTGPEIGRDARGRDARVDIVVVRDDGGIGCPPLVELKASGLRVAAPASIESSELRVHADLFEAGSSRSACRAVATAARRSAPSRHRRRRRAGGGPSPPTTSRQSSSRSTDS